MCHSRTLPLMGIPLNGTMWTQCRFLCHDPIINWSTKTIFTWNSLITLIQFGEVHLANTHLWEHKTQMCVKFGHLQVAPALTLKLSLPTTQGLSQEAKVVFCDTFCMFMRPQDVFWWKTVNGNITLLYFICYATSFNGANFLQEHHKWLIHCLWIIHHTCVSSIVSSSNDFTSGRLGL